MQPRKSFRTPKGNELPLLNLKGKEYLQVAHRLVFFRETHPNGIIKTELIDKGGEGQDAYVIFRAEIYIDSGDGRGPLMVSSGHKRESKKDFPDYVEKCETGACGRALALAGFGTQFTSDELDEGSRLADAPLEPMTTVSQEKVTQVMSQDGSARRGSFRKNVTKTDVAVGDDI